MASGSRPPPSATKLDDVDGAVDLLKKVLDLLGEEPEALNALGTGDDSSSLLNLWPQLQLAYPLSKRAIVRLVAREATSFGERKARIVSISPGLIDTAMGRAEQAASQQMDAMLAETPLARLGEADEIASVAVFLCSPDASFVSGCDIRIDGGLLAALGK